MNEVLHTKWGNAKIYNKGYYVIASTKEGNNMKLLHRLIWEDFWGTKISKGYVIHHKNGNKVDNCILNLQLMRENEHKSLHMAGENHPMFGVDRSGENNYNWKDYARIIKHGKQSGKQVYAIRFNGKNIKSSIDKNKLVKWFNENYPDKELINND